MKYTLLTILVFILLSSGNRIQAKEGRIVGKWLTEEETSHVKLFKATNGKYYGKIVWLRDEPDKLDENNPNESKRDVPLLNLLILKGFESCERIDYVELASSVPHSLLRG